MSALPCRSGHRSDHDALAREQPARGDDCQDADGGGFGDKVRLATRPVSVAEILQVVPVSRRSLERRFVAVLGRMPQQEIDRTRLERAKRLLADTDLPLFEVAKKAGFRSVQRLCQVFNQRVSQSPAAYRKLHQPGGW